MKTLRLLGIAPLVLLAATAFPQGHAVPRGGGSGGGGGSSAGSRHTGGGGGGGGSSSHSSPSNNGGGSSASSGGSNYSAPGAAGRRPRPGSGTGTRDHYGNEYNHYGYGYGYGGYYGGYYGYPYYGYGYGYYPYYYAPYAYWGYPSYSYGIGFSYYGGYPYNYYGAAAATYGGGGGGGGGSYESSPGAVAQVRTLVDPAKTLVYVDGRQAGTADDFDGMFQRLNISPGKHEIELRLEGYGTHTYTVYAAPEETLKLRWDMARGGGNTKEVIGEEYARRVEGDRDQDRARERERELAREAERDRESAPREVDSAPPSERPSITVPGSGQGEVFFEIQPFDASVYVDGEFRGKASQLTRLQLPAGRHRVEVVRPGYRTTETVITVEGEAKKLVIKLDR